MNLGRYIHICFKTTGSVPHVGGPIVQDSANVFIGGMPAAKVGDKLVCVGPPDTIKSGSKSVSINGKAAARLGDSTNHGGKIVMGNPTVLIGDKPWRGPNEDTLPVAPAAKTEVARRLDSATTAVAVAKATGQPLPPPAYTSMDKLFTVCIGLEERFLLRLVETKYAGDDGYIGRVPEGATSSTYWTATFTELEHAGRDPELLCKAVGKTYNPEASYTLLVIDQVLAAEAGDMHSFTPTYENLAEFAKNELPNEFDDEQELLAPAMTAEYSRQYEQLFNQAQENKVNLNIPEDFTVWQKALAMMRVKPSYCRCGISLTRT